MRWDNEECHDYSECHWNDSTQINECHVSSGKMHLSYNSQGEVILTETKFNDASCGGIVEDTSTEIITTLSYATGEYETYWDGSIQDEVEDTRFKVWHEWHPNSTFQVPSDTNSVAYGLLSLNYDYHGCVSGDVNSFTLNYAGK
jgi:hypothetical protein